MFLDHVAFGDGAKGRILAKGNIMKPQLNDVRYVEGLKANLISVSQLCDHCELQQRRLCCDRH